MEKINQLPTKSLILLVNCYRYFISPFLGNHCRFHPSCSCYTLQALNQYGFVKGLWLALIRLAKCHPFHPGGCDPLPESKQR